MLDPRPLFLSTPTYARGVPWRTAVHFLSWSQVISVGDGVPTGEVKNGHVWPTFGRM